MASTTLNTRIALKIDTAAAWASSSLVLLKGEVAIESDTRKFKIGDGVKTFAQLEYAAQLPNIVATTDPTTSDSGYDVGTIWINKTAGTSFFMQSNADAAAVWVRLANKSEIESLTSDAMLKSVYDTDASGSVDKADSLKSGSSFLTVNDSNTTGLWTASKINTELGKKANSTDLNDYILKSQMGVASGVATLDSNGLVPSSQLPSYVDDVIEAANKAALPSAGEAGKIYVTLDDNKTYRWSGTTYVEISASLALGETAGTAYEGSKGKANATAIAALQGDVQNIQNTLDGLGALAHKDTVAEADIDASAVTTAKIADGNVTEAKLAANSVTTAKIADGNVTEAKLAANSVTTDKIVDKNVTTDKIADEAVTVTQLASNAVTEVKIASNAVTTAKIADGNVTDAKIATVNANKLIQTSGDYLVFNCGNATA